MKKKHGMLKGMTEEKEKTIENEKPRVFLKKRLWEGGGKGNKEQNISRIAGNPFLSH